MTLHYGLGLNGDGTKMKSKPAASLNACCALATSADAGSVRADQVDRELLAVLWRDANPSQRSKPGVDTIDRQIPLAGLRNPGVAAEHLGPRMLCEGDRLVAPGNINDVLDGQAVTIDLESIHGLRVIGLGG